jgi:hypothetical protein
MTRLEVAIPDAQEAAAAEGATAAAERQRQQGELAELRTRLAANEFTLVGAEGAAPLCAGLCQVANLDLRLVGVCEIAFNKAGSAYNLHTACSHCRQLCHVDCVVHMTQEQP